MKVIVCEARQINRYARLLDKEWKFFCCFANIELYNDYVKSTTQPGCVWHGWMEFRQSEQEVYGL